MDFNLPRYTEYFQETCNVNDLLDISPNQSCRINSNGDKILDEDYDDLRNNWLSKWNEEYTNTTDPECRAKFLTKLIDEIKETNSIRQGMDNEINSNSSSITNRHNKLNKINNSIDDIEENYLLGEQRLLETQGLNYINNAKFYIFIALIIILLLIQLMLILL